MKLKHYFIPLLAICALLSCSEDKEEPQGPDITPNAFLSLGIKTETKTKTGLGDAPGVVVLDPENPRNIISRLSVFVYDGNTCYAKDSTLESNAVTVNEVAGIPVRAGQVDVLVVANGDLATLAKLKTYKNIEEVKEAVLQTEGLEKELHKELTMSSQFFSASLAPNKVNCIGYSKAPADGYIVSTNAVKLYRNVARIQLQQVTLKKETDFGVAESFEIDSIFVANVKSRSYLLPTDGAPWGPVNVPYDEVESRDWWYGSTALKGGDGDSLKKVTGDVVLKRHLAYSFLGEEQTFLYSDDKQAWDTKREVTPELPYRTDEELKNALSIGNFFYVYENMEAPIGFQTLLVVRGNYTYKPAGSKITITEKGRYYTVVVNDPANRVGISFDENVGEHKLVKRNTKYEIYLEIQGPGSKYPYDPSARAYVGAKLEVMPWDVVKMNGSID